MNLNMTYDQAVQEARERQDKREISDDAARVLTAAWYAPSVPAMVAVATDAWSPESLTVRSEDDTQVTRGDEFRTDLYRTFHKAALDRLEEANGATSPESEEMIVWSALGTWSMNGGDNDDT